MHKFPILYFFDNTVNFPYIFIFVSDKNIRPIFYRKTNEIYSFRIMKFIFSAHFLVAGQSIYLCLCLLGTDEYLRQHRGRDRCLPQWTAEKSFRKPINILSRLNPILPNLQIQIRQNLTFHYCMLYFPIHQLPTSILQLLTPPTSISQYFAAMQLRIVLMPFLLLQIFCCYAAFKANSQISNLYLLTSNHQPLPHSFALSVP
jgi:hypothetical protein